MNIVQLYSPTHRLLTITHFRSNSSMRTKTGTLRVLGKWRTLSQSLFGRTPVHRKVRGLWLQDMPQPLRTHQE